MDHYEHTQSGTLIRITFGVCLVILGAVAVVLMVSGIEAGVILGGVALLHAILLAAFHALTVRVSVNTIEVVFGVGIVRKSFIVDEIVSAEIVQNPWYYGWGIKKYPGGWLYNVSGPDAVEIQYQNGKKYRIGTDQPAELLEAIESKISIGQRVPGAS